MENLSIFLGKHLVGTLSRHTKITALTLTHINYLTTMAK